jgi:hypothetical protein
MAKKQIIRLTEGDLHRVIKESVNQILMEYKDFDGFDNDLDYNNIFDQACEYIVRNEPITQSWRSIAKGLGFQLNTIGPNDMETLKDAIEDAMGECGGLVNESFSDIYQPHNFSDITKEYYKAFVVLDGTEAIIGNFDNYDDAVEYAKELAAKHKYSTYNVYGVDEKNEYVVDEDDTTLVYSTDEDFI